MSIKSARFIPVVFLLLFLPGCFFSFLNIFTGGENKTGASFPENSYFYFTESQILKNRGNLNKALEYMESAVALDQESVFLKGELVNLYLQKKENDKALTLVEEVLGKDPENIGALILFGRIKHALGKVADAKKAYEKIIAGSPKQQNIYLLLGSLYVEEGEFDKAISVFEKLIKNFPDYYLGYFYLGKINAQKGNPDEAEKSYSKAIELKPNLDEPRFELINLYKIRGEKDKIIPILHEMLKKNPDNIRAALELGYFYKKNNMPQEGGKILRNLGTRSLSNFDVVVNVIQFYLDTRRYNDTTMILEDMLKGAPESSDLNHIAGLSFFALKNEDTALSHFLKVKSDSRFYSDAAVHVSLIYQNKGKLREAILFIRDVIEREPDNPEFLFYLGLFHEELEEYKDAEKALLKAISIDQDDSRLYFRLGVVYDKWGKKEKTLEQMKTVIKIDPKNANALNYLGYTYAEMGENLEEAEKLITEALKYKPDDGYITDSLGWVYFKKGLYDKALEALNKATRLVPEDPVILEHLGDVYMKMKDGKNALEAYKRSLLYKKENQDAIKTKIRAITGEGR
ncbi:MAG: tetratricopeptide repeat protein [Desulfobacteraceae bacterium]|nr:MAG: tetratricopeptide repeat protein [Desulfobacteraceae bacterium]